MKILLLGKNGQVGWELQRSLAPLGKVIALASDSTQWCGNLADLDGIAATVRAIAPDVIVNAAAYTAVDRAETDSLACHTVNALAPAVLAAAAAQIGALLVHYSTDYVFDGSGNAPRDESAIAKPLSVYGSTKLEGEQAIVESGCHHLIFRTSWVYAARGSNFISTMLRLAGERESLSVVADQFGAPTGADLIADVTAHAIRCTVRRTDLSGIYHLVAGGKTSWHGYASYVIDLARKSGAPIKVAQTAISAVSSDAFQTVAIRPKNSTLSTKKLQSAFALELPEWQYGVARMLCETIGIK